MPSFGAPLLLQHSALAHHELAAAAPHVAGSRSHGIRPIPASFVGDAAASVKAGQPSKDCLPLDIHVIIRQPQPGRTGELTVGNPTQKAQAGGGAASGQVIGAEGTPEQPGTPKHGMPKGAGGAKEAPDGQPVKKTAGMPAIALLAAPPTRKSRRASERYASSFL
mmetsp:Transcript_31984/g.73012  ORF Transcript_31984/g.73012 Transcript_31984/m.73012 type:complete len:165 (+) Transcript_31984:112-606(+)